MKVKQFLLAVLLRLSFLVLPFFGLYLLYTFTYDPHAHCVGDDHRHTGGPVGYVIIAGILAIIWVFTLLIELIWRLVVKKESQISWGNLFMIVFFGLIVLFLFNLI